MKNAIVILMLTIFAQATVCSTVFCFLDELEIITLDLSTSTTLIEEEETHDEYSSEERNHVIPHNYVVLETDFSYLTEQRNQLLPGYTDRVFSPPELV